MLRTPISGMTLMINCGNIYNGFHEIAQLNLAKHLHSLGEATILEYPISGVGEVDVVAGNRAWEVKPWGSRGGAQLNKYLTGGALEPGYSFFPIMEIPIVADIKMAVVPSALEPGVANYFFYIGPTAAIRERVLSRDVKKDVLAHLSVPVAAAGIIIIATLVEDIFTGGIGVINDLPCFAAASGLAASALFG